MQHRQIFLDGGKAVVAPVQGAGEQQHALGRDALELLRILIDIQVRNDAGELIPRGMVFMLPISPARLKLTANGHGSARGKTEPPLWHDGMYSKNYLKSNTYNGQGVQRG